MPSAAVIAAALTDHSSRVRTLTVGGVDVILEPGTGTRYGTPIDSIHVTERGHEGVSSMSFVVEDFGLEFSVADGMEVVYQIVAPSDVLDTFTFRGWVDHWDQQPTVPGRTYAISAIGAETLLDWAMLIADLVLPSGMTALDAIQSTAANSYGTGPLRWASSTSNSSRVSPVANNLSGFTLAAALTITAGTSLREAIRQILVATAAYNSLSAGVYQTTVDFFYGLRVYSTSGVLGFGVLWDYSGTGAVLDTTASNTKGGTQDFHYDTEGATVRSVFVKGANAAGTGFVTDGSGLLGGSAYITDPTSDTAARLALVGQAYLNSFASKVRGTATLGPVAQTEFAAVHTGDSFGPVTDTAFPGNISTIEIMQIDKEFIGSTETWTFAIGGFPPSGTNLMRRFTGQPRG